MGSSDDSADSSSYPKNWEICHVGDVWLAQVAIDVAQIHVDIVQSAANLVGLLLHQ